MLILDLAKKIQNYVIKGKLPAFRMSIDTQKSFLKSLPEPINLIERSYYQYLCQAKQLPMYLRIIQNIAAIIYIPFYIPLKFRKPIEVKQSNGNLAVFISGSNDFSYIPNSLKREFDEIIHVGYGSPNSLLLEELKFIKNFSVKYWYKPYFLIKCIMKIGLYSEQIRKHNPKAIITFAEFSFTSSVLTEYCNLYGIEHINIMHGEKLYNIRNSFVGFNSYYVWDTHYVELHIKLRAMRSQFIIEQPEFLDLYLEKSLGTKYNLTYYLGAEDNRTIHRIANILSKLDYTKDSISIRPHPRYSNKKIINKIFDGFTIEDNGITTIQESLSRTNLVVSLNSTVLYQAIINGKVIVIDDLSNPNKYERLKDLDYICMKKPHKLLSSMINNQ